MQKHTVSKLRVLLIPITKNCYALHANTIYKSLSSINKPEHIDHDHHPPNRITIKHLPVLNKIRSPKIRNFVDKQLTEIHHFWLDCEEKSESDPKSYKGRIHKYAENILQRIDGYESFFGAIPYKMLQPKSDSKPAKIPNPKNEVENDQKSEETHDHKMRLSYIIPNGVNKNEAINHLKLITERKLKFHQKWMYLNMSILPFTALLGILPGPNVFVLYNGFRLYSHYKAYHGAMSIEQRQPEFEIVGDEFLGEIYKDLQDDEKEINDDNLHKLQTKFDCQHVYHHLHRVRYQIVDLQRDSRYQLLTI